MRFSGPDIDLAYQEQVRSALAHLDGLLAHLSRKDLEELRATAKRLLRADKHPEATVLEAVDLRMLRVLEHMGVIERAGTAVGHDAYRRAGSDAHGRSAWWDAIRDALVLNEDVPIQEVQARLQARLTRPARVSDELSTQTSTAAPDNDPMKPTDRQASMGVPGDSLAAVLAFEWNGSVRHAAQILMTVVINATEAIQRLAPEDSVAVIHRPAPEGQTSTRKEYLVGVLGSSHVVEAAIDDDRANQHLELRSSMVTRISKTHELRHTFPLMIPFAEVLATHLEFIPWKCIADDARAAGRFQRRVHRFITANHLISRIPLK